MILHEHAYKTMQQKSDATTRKEEDPVSVYKWISLLATKRYPPQPSSNPICLFWFQISAYSKSKIIFFFI